MPFKSSLEIVQTIGRLREAPRTDWSGPNSWKNPEFKTRLN